MWPARLPFSLAFAMRPLNLSAAPRLASVRRSLATVTDRTTRAGPSDNRVRLVEVGARDGLQNEKVIVPLDTKIALIKRLALTGLKDIEAGSFVAPKWVPQVCETFSLLLLFWLIGRIGLIQV